MTIDWSRFCRIVREHQRFVLTSHVRPDCDALGSELGLCGVLEALGKQVRVVNADSVPPHLDFIDPTRRVEQWGQDVQPDQLADFEVLIILDTSARVQLGSVTELIDSGQFQVVVVDHHLSSDDLGAAEFKNVEAESTGRLVMEAADALQVPLTAAIAMPLFMAIATDTGWFRFSNVQPATFAAAARLVEAGVRPSQLYESLYEQDTLGRVHLRGLILSRVTLEVDGRLAHSYVLLPDFQRLQALPSDTEDVINMSLAIAGTEVAVFFTQQPDSKFKVSFRSRSQVDCSRLAETFGGGGHRAASGAMVEGSLEDVRRRVLDVIREAMR